MKKSFLYLVIVTILAVLVLVVFTPGQRQTSTTGPDELLLPEMSSRINDVSHVEIICAGETRVASLSRKEDAWVVEEMAGYPADWPRLQTLLSDLATARVVELKTDNPDYYSRLGIEDVKTADAGSMLLRLVADNESVDILIGNRASNRDGQYVRLASARAGALVDRTFDVPSTPEAWLDTQIIDINASEVAEVEVLHPDRDRVLVTRVSADETDFMLEGLPENREIKSSWAVNSLASSLSMLDLQSVYPDEGIDWDSAVKLRMLLFSGIELMVELIGRDEEKLLRIQAARPGVSEDIEAADGPADADSTLSTQEQAANDVAARTQDINRRTGGWVYRISQQKYDAMVKRTEDLLKPLTET